MFSLPAFDDPLLDPFMTGWIDDRMGGHLVGEWTEMKEVEYGEDGHLVGEFTFLSACRASLTRRLFASFLVTSSRTIRVGHVCVVELIPQWCIGFKNGSGGGGSTSSWKKYHS